MMTSFGENARLGEATANGLVDGGRVLTGDVGAQLGDQPVEALLIRCQ
jgi:hypothetical protein